MSNQQRQVATPCDAPVLFFAYENNAADPSGKMLIYHLFTLPHHFPKKTKRYHFHAIFCFSSFLVVPVPLAICLRGNPLLFSSGRPHVWAKTEGVALHF
jgi:hypothetical protein